MYNKIDNMKTKQIQFIGTNEFNKYFLRHTRSDDQEFQARSICSERHRFIQSAYKSLAISLSAHLLVSSLIQSKYSYYFKHIHLYELSHIL